MDRYKVSFIIQGHDLDPSDLLDIATDDIAPNMAARAEAFYDEDSITVEAVKGEGR